MKKEYKLTIIGLVTMLIFVIGASFAFFQLNSTNTSSSSNFTGELENITDYGKSVLSGGLDGLHIKINVSDMALSKIGTHYYATVDSKKNYELARQKHEISKVTIAEGINNENIVYSCTSDLTIQLEGSMLEDSLVSGDGMIYFSGSNMRLNPQNIDLAELISKSEDKLVEDKNIKEYKNTIEYIISGNGEATLETDIEIVNRAEKQNDMAGKNINITITNENIVCSVSGKKVYASLDNDYDDYGTTYRSSEYKDKIVSASFVDYVPSEEELSQKVVHWNLTDTTEHNGYSSPSNSVIGWLEATEENPEQYNLYIGSQDYIYATDLSYAFYSMTTLKEINFENLNTSETTNMSGMFRGYTGASLDLSSFDTSKVTDMSGMFMGVSADLPFKDWTKFTTSNVENMGGMFNNYKGTTLDLSTFDTSNVENMSGMFANYIQNGKILKLSNLENFNTQNVIDMRVMFEKLDIGDNEIKMVNWNTSKVKSVSAMFQGFNGSIDMENLDFSNLSEFDFVFSHGKRLILKNIDFSNITSFEGSIAANEYDEIVMENLKTPKLTNMSSMFSESSTKKITLENIDTSKVTDMSNMFYNCNNLTELNLSGFNTENVENMEAMFYDCNNLNSLDLHEFYTPNVTNMYRIFGRLHNIKLLDIRNFTFNDQNRFIFDYPDGIKWNYNITIKIRSDQEQFIRNSIEQFNGDIQATIEVV